MHAGRRFTWTEVMYWTRRDILFYLVWGAIPTVLYAIVGWTWLTLPWVPIAAIATAVAFIVGFKNNATYNRLWEARQIYGAIVNSSRSWAIMALDFVTAPVGGNVDEADVRAARTRLIHRHIAWLHALRFQLRAPRAWEHMIKVYNREFRTKYTVDEQDGNKLADALTGLIGNDEKALVLSKSNVATQLIAQQSRDLRELHAKGLIHELRHVEMQNMLVDLYGQQGKCERIKNFPYPRQYATLNLMFVRLFNGMIPFGILGEFAKLGEHFVWLTIPFTAVVAWVFIMMERIGESTENPFEGSANDVPITAMTRTIEIDLREMLGETNIPEPLKPQHNILM
ncbi:MAG: multidrug transporter [Flavobacteriales bacterium]|nr:multidrug transporter [Flavobacteriales bacterium]